VNNIGIYNNTVHINYNYVEIQVHGPVGLYQDIEKVVFEKPSGNEHNDLINDIIEQYCYLYGIEYDLKDI
jgi:hypothetical protein